VKSSKPRVHKGSSFQDDSLVGSAETWLASQNIKIDIRIRLSEILPWKIGEKR
jgi:hypothetical protein